MATEISNQLYSTLSVHSIKSEAAHDRETAVRVETVYPDPAAQAAEKPREVEKLVRELAEMSQTMNRRLQFRVDQSTNDVVVKVIDGNTDKVIKELPPEEIQRLHRRITEAIGLLFNEVI